MRNVTDRTLGWRWCSNGAQMRRLSGSDQPLRWTVCDETGLLPHEWRPSRYHPAILRRAVRYRDWDDGRVPEWIRAPV